MRKPSPFLNHSFVAPWAIARVTKDSGPTQLIKHQFYRETKRAAFPAFQISIKMQIMEKWKWIHSITTPAKKGTEFAEKSFKRLFPCVAVDSFLSERTCERASEKKCREEVEGGEGVKRTKQISVEAVLSLIVKQKKWGVRTCYNNLNI